MRSGATSISAARRVATTNGAVTTSMAGCADGRAVGLMTVDGGGHEWPGFATDAMWQFFAAHAQ